MKILFAASEAHPLIKTGGLGDVAGSLPIALKKLGCDVHLVMPAYREALKRLPILKHVATIDIGDGYKPVRLLEGKLPDSDVTLWMIASPKYFDRPGGPYGDLDGTDWQDNAERFAVFARAVVAIATNRVSLSWQPDVVHCHDWQTALIPALLALRPSRPATVFTIHNLSYQGLYPWETFQALHLPYDLWTMHGMEFHGLFSFIKGGLAYADMLSTVSPSYAEEILTPEFGCGLDALLNHRADRLEGILNGVDYQVWDPAHDALIHTPYSAKTLKKKLTNKAVCQQAFKLPEAGKTPLIGHIGRLVEQKGADLILESLPELLTEKVQIAILGSGDKVLETELLEAAEAHPKQLAVHIGYNETLAHTVEAGSDMFVMPSRFEPCGLNQIYSLRYGTVPIVHRTGGLADTVTDATEQHLKDETATGFVFNKPDAASLTEAMQRAIKLYGQPRKWHNLALTGMAQDFSWERSAEQYLGLYQEAMGHAAGDPRT